MDMEQEERARREARVMSGLAGLAASEAEYTDVVQASLRLVEQLVASPLLCLSIREAAAVEHYARIGAGLEPAWVEEAGRMLAQAQEARLTSAASVVGPYSIAGPPAWFLAFPAVTRSGRFGALALGSPEPLTILSDEEGLMLRLAAQVLLVLDHALSLAQMQEGDPTDRLTGVASHRRLLDMLDYELKRHRYVRRWLALMLLDVEGLDGINRSYGRHYGNHILTQLARLVEDAVRPIDLVARCGVHDFGVMLPETDAEEGWRLSGALLERFMAVQFAGGAVGLSIGVAHARPDEVLSPDGLLRRAEGALQESKQQRQELDALSLNPLAGTRGRPTGR